jgi:hypothetical protein
MMRLAAMPNITNYGILTQDFSTAFCAGAKSARGRSNLLYLLNRNEKISLTRLTIFFVISSFAVVRPTVATSVPNLPNRGGQLLSSWGTPQKDILMPTHPAKISEDILMPTHPAKISEDVLMPTHPAEVNEDVLMPTHPSA